jgi:transcriptional regulator with XRE-family HTH domain
MLQLRAIRQEKGVSLRLLKKRSDVAVATLARIEAGGYDPRLGTLRRLAKALDVTLIELIGEGHLNNSGKEHVMASAAKQRDKAVQAKLNAASRAANSALDKWRAKYIDKRMSPLMYGYDYKEFDLLIKLLRTKIYNQTKTQ